MQRSNPFIRTTREPQSSMSIEPKEPIRDLPFQHQEVKKVEQEKTIKEEKFVWILGEATNEKNVAINFPLNILVGEKSKYLEISTMRLQMNQLKQNEFPDFIGLYCKNLDGYLNNNNVSTHILSVAFAQASINYGISEGTTNSHKNILYENKTENIWDVTGMTQAILSIVTSDNPETPLTLPLNSPVVIEGRIIRFIE